MYFYIAVKKLIKEILPLNLKSDQKTFTKILNKSK